MAHELTADECVRLALICRWQLRRRLRENLMNPGQPWSSRLAEAAKKTREENHENSLITGI